MLGPELIRFCYAASAAIATLVLLNVFASLVR